MALSPEQKLQTFKMLLAQSQFDFSIAEKVIDKAFMDVISDSQQQEVLTHKIVIQQKQKYVEIVKTKSGKGLWVCGNTFPYRVQLKALGGKWNSYKNAWVFTLTAQQELLELFQIKEDEIGIEHQ